MIRRRRSALLGELLDTLFKGRKTSRRWSLPAIQRPADGNPGPTRAVGQGGGANADAALCAADFRHSVSAPLHHRLSHFDRADLCADLDRRLLRQPDRASLIWIEHPGSAVDAGPRLLEAAAVVGAAFLGGYLFTLRTLLRAVMNFEFEPDHLAARGGASAQRFYCRAAALPHARRDAVSQRRAANHRPTRRFAAAAVARGRVRRRLCAGLRAVDAGALPAHHILEERRRRRDEKRRHHPDRDCRRHRLRRALSSRGNQHCRYPEPRHLQSGPAVRGNAIRTLRGVRLGVAGAALSRGRAEDVSGTEEIQGAHHLRPGKRRDRRRHRRAYADDRCIALRRRQSRCAQVHRLRRGRSERAGDARCRERPARGCRHGRQPRHPAAAAALVGDLQPAHAGAGTTDCGGIGAFRQELPEALAASPQWGEANFS